MFLTEKAPLMQIASISMAIIPHWVKVPAPGCLLWQGARRAAAQLSQVYKHWASVWNCNNATNIDIFPPADVISAHVMLLQIKTGQYSIQPPPRLGKQWVDILGIIDTQHASHLATISSNKLLGCCCLTHLLCICSCSAELDTYWLSCHATDPGSEHSASFIIADGD